MKDRLARRRLSKGKLTYFYVGSYRFYAGSFFVLLVCREGKTESHGVWRAYVGHEGEEAISEDGQSSRLVPTITGQVL